MPKTILQKLNEVEKLSQQSSQLEGNFNDLSTSIEILSDVILDTNRNVDEKLNKAKDELSRKIEDVKKMPGTPGKDGKDGADGLDGLDGKDGSPDTPTQVKDKLESLKGEARLDKSAVKGLEKVLGQEDLDRAVSILDSRTSFLINKINNLNISSNWSSILGTPTEVSYFNAAGNGTSDSMFTRDENTKETLMGFETYATGLINDGIGQEVIWQADNVGSVGNSITLVFDGTDDTDTVLAAWNAANPSNTASVVGGTGNFTPTADTVILGGGGSAGYELAHNFLGQGFQFAGTLFSDGGFGASINGLLNSQDGTTPFIGSFNFGTGDQSILQMSPNNFGIRVTGASNDSGLEINSNDFSLQSTIGASETSIASDSLGNLRLKVQNILWKWPTADGSNGYVLKTDGAGNLSFGAIPPASASLTQNQIGFGSASNLLSGNSNFIYNGPLYYFSQSMPNNINNGTALGSPLTFGTATWNTTGNNNLTLNWSVSNYQSNKYGGNLTLDINTPGTLDWVYTGSYSEIIGQGAVSYSSGVPFNLQDSNGNTIAQVTFTGANTGGEKWVASTSLASNSWGMGISDSDGHQFINIRPVYGEYYVGDDNSPTPLAGNGTRLQINDAVAELGLYAKRYFRIENPAGTWTAVLADMENQRWLNYGEFRVLDVASGAVWFDVDSASKQIQIGDVQSTNNKTNLVVNDNSLIIHANTDGEFAVRNTTANKFLETATSTGVTTIGDIDSVLLDTLLTVDPTNDTIDFSAKGIDTNSVDIPITVKTTMSSSDILNMNTTPVIPTMTVPTGYAVQILDVYGRLNYNTTPYATNTTINIVFSTAVGQSVWQSANVLGDTANVIRRFTKTSGSAAEVVIPNDPLVITCIAGNPTAGDSTVDVYITYKLIEL